MTGTQETGNNVLLKGGPMATVQSCENIHGMQLTNMELESHIIHFNKHSCPIIINQVAPCWVVKTNTLHLKAHTHWTDLQSADGNSRPNRVG